MKILIATKNFLSTLGWYAIRHPLGNFVVVTTIIFLIATLTTFSRSPAQFDPIILIYAAVMSLAVVLTILFKTKLSAWTTLNVGLLGVFFGLTFFFSELTYQAIVHGYEHRQTMLAIARSIFVTSTTWVLVGLFLEWWYETHMCRERFFWILRHPILAFRNRNKDKSKG